VTASNEEGSPFRIPYELYHEYEFFRLTELLRRQRSSRLPSPYIHVSSSIYTPSSLEFIPKAEMHKCSCPRQSGCGSSCVNRHMLQECDVRSCPCGKLCTNRRFQQRQYAKLGVEYKGESKGWGLIAIAPIRANDFIIEYVGEVISLAESQKRVVQYGQEKNFYLLGLTNHLHIDATAKGNRSRFTNHSCDPNCHTQKWTVKGVPRIGVFASKDIAKGEEITFDYQFQRSGVGRVKCYCGSANCRGYLDAKKKDMPNAYKPQKVPDFVRDKEHETIKENYTRHAVDFSEAIGDAFMYTKAGAELIRMELLREEEKAAKEEAKQREKEKKRRLNKLRYKRPQKEESDEENGVEDAGEVEVTPSETLTGGEKLDLLVDAVPPVFLDKNVITGTRYVKQFVSNLHPDLDFSTSEWLAIEAEEAVPLVDREKKEEVDEEGQVTGGDEGGEPTERSVRTTKRMRLESTSLPPEVAEEIKQRVRICLNGSSVRHVTVPLKELPLLSGETQEGQVRASAMELEKVEEPPAATRNDDIGEGAVKSEPVEEKTPTKKEKPSSSSMGDANAMEVEMKGEHASNPTAELKEPSEEKPPEEEKKSVGVSLKSLVAQSKFPQMRLDDVFEKKKLEEVKRISSFLNENRAWRKNVFVPLERHMKNSFRKKRKLSSSTTSSSSASTSSSHP